MTSVFDNLEIKQIDPEVKRLTATAGQAVKKARIAKSKSQKFVADKAGTTQKIVSYIESGKAFQYSTLVRMCLALRLQPEIRLLPWRDPSLPPLTKREKYLIEIGRLDEDLKEIE